MSKPKSPNRRSVSPKKRRGPTEDDVLIESRMTANVVEQPTNQFYALSAAISLLPIYLAVYLYEVPLTITSVVLFAAVSGAVVYMLTKAYAILFFASREAECISGATLQVDGGSSFVRARTMD